MEKNLETLRDLISKNTSNSERVNLLLGYMKEELTRTENHVSDFAETVTTHAKRIETLANMLTDSSLTKEEEKLLRDYFGREFAGLEETVFNNVSAENKENSTIPGKSYIMAIQKKDGDSVTYYPVIEYKSKKTLKPKLVQNVNLMEIQKITRPAGCVIMSISEDDLKALTRKLNKQAAEALKTLKQGVESLRKASQLMGHKVEKLNLDAEIAKIQTKKTSSIAINKDGKMI